MTLLIAAEPVPLVTDEHGVVRVKNSRVTLDSIIAAFNKNASVEEVAEAHPTLDKADIYTIVAYYLHHQEDVEAYLAEQEAKAEALRQKIEARYPTAAVRNRVLERWNKIQQVLPS